MQRSSSGRVAVAMSGGVDSSIAALLLKERGYEVLGLTLRLGQNAEGHSRRQIDDARHVAEVLGIPHQVVEAREPFARLVIDRFVSEYMRGRTPSPCLVCNREIKFGLLVEKAHQMGFDQFATGHYARVERDPDTGRPRLLRGRDHRRDQSYFLSMVRLESIQNVLFPLGDLTKRDAYKKAREANLTVPIERESQEVCFVPPEGIGIFVRKWSSKQIRGGWIVDAEGNKVGMHNGIVDYTVGQRRGLGIAVGRPQYVTKIDPEQNTVTIGDDRGLYVRHMLVEEVNWLVDDRSIGERRISIQIRSQHTPAIAHLRSTDSTCIGVRFDDPQRGIAPGQAAVFYDEDQVLGGGWIV